MRTYGAAGKRINSMKQKPVCLAFVSASARSRFPPPPPHPELMLGKLLLVTKKSADKLPRALVLASIDCLIIAIIQFIPFNP